MWIDFVDFEKWNKLIPFGSALLGAMVGGGITYATAKAKERKEERVKRLESLFEMQSNLLILIHKFNNIKLKVEKITI